MLIIRIKNFVLGRILRVISNLLSAGPRFCCYCKKNIFFFLPYRGGSKYAPAVGRLTHMIGSDIDHFGCPACGSTDRERHLRLFLEKLNFFEKNIDSILHMAPEERLLKYLIEKTKAKNYICGDLFPTKPSIQKIDITAIPFNDNNFDLFVANHVLEHVPDDIKALKEIFRILKPGGFAILQTPYSASLTQTFEDPAIKSDEARLYFYAQEDHVRLYGKDLFDRIQKVGFHSMMKRHDEILADIDQSKYGVNPEEPLLLFQKPF